MNYLKIYNSLVERAKERGLNKKLLSGYYEVHHILPRSIGGTNEHSNLVLFTAREHFIAHMLLWKIYPKEDGLKYAAMLMSNRFNFSKINSKVYARLRKDLGIAQSKRRKGKIADLTGQKFSRLLVIELGEVSLSSSGKNVYKWLCQCDCGKYTSVIAGSLLNKNTQSCGCLSVDTAKSRKGENNPFFGIKHSQETKDKIYNTKVENGVWWPREYRTPKAPLKGRRVGENHPFYGKRHSEKSLLKMSLALRSLNIRPWENYAAQRDDWQRKWALCDLYYDLWVKYGKCGLKKFTRLYNEEFNDNVSLAYFTNPRLHFVDGWIPQEDEEWIEFSKRYKEKHGV